MDSTDPDFKYSLASRKLPRKILTARSPAVAAASRMLDIAIASSMFDAPSTSSGTTALTVPTSAPFSFPNPFTTAQPSVPAAPTAPATSGFTFSAPGAAPTLSFPVPALPAYQELTEEEQAANDSLAFLDEPHQFDEEELIRQLLGLDEPDPPAASTSASGAGAQSTDQHQQQAGPQLQLQPTDAEADTDMEVDVARPQDALLPEAEGGGSNSAGPSSSSAPPHDKFAIPWDEWTAKDKDDLDFEVDPNELDFQTQPNELNFQTDPSLLELMAQWEGGINRLAAMDPTAAVEAVAMGIGHVPGPEPIYADDPEDVETPQVDVNPHLRKRLVAKGPSRRLPGL